MPIYTCFDMVQDCRADKREGWTYFIREYIPVAGELMRHYYPGRDAELLNRVLLGLRKPESGLFARTAPCSEREFAAELRQYVLAAVEEDCATEAADVPLDMEALAAVLQPFTLVERQVVWLEAMRYDADATAAMMGMDPATVNKIRDKAAEALRGRLDAWRRSMIADNGATLRDEVGPLHTDQCLKVNVFLDLLDGRLTWYQREDIERHLAGCWWCIDLFCRTREVVVILRRRKPLAAEEAEPFHRLLGVSVEEKRPLWKRILYLFTA